MQNKQVSTTVGFICLLLILLPLEYFCAGLAFETLGELSSGFYYLLLIVLNMVPVVLFIFKKRTAGFVLVFLIGLLIIPWQLKLGYRLLLLKEESANMVNFAYEYQLEHGSFPKDVSEYTFKYEGLKKHLHYYYSEHDRSFQVTYWVGTRTTSHFYRPEIDKWCYYPD